MSEEMIVRHCSPTLAGLKTGSLFGYFFTDANEMRESIRSWNKILVNKGLRMIPLKFKDKRALIYIYRPLSLSKDLKNKTACKLLEERGYNLDKSEYCITHLMKRLNLQDEFPHEIGLFLGYPPEDVNGFIENKADNFKLVGTWKVYGDVTNAKKTFERYKKCTDIYSQKISEGRSIEKLIVNIKQ